MRYFLGQESNFVFESKVNEKLVYKVNQLNVLHFDDLEIEIGL